VAPSQVDWSLPAPHIAEVEFAPSRRGLDEHEVRGFLRAVAARIESLEDELRQARARADEIERREGAVEEAAYTRLCARVSEVLRAADAVAADIRERAEREAARTSRAAGEEAARILGHAGREAARIVADGRVEADDLLTSARRRLMYERTWAEPTPIEPVIDLGPLEAMLAESAGAADALSSQSSVDFDFDLGFDGPLEVPFPDFLDDDHDL